MNWSKKFAPKVSVKHEVEVFKLTCTTASFITMPPEEVSDTIFSCTALLSVKTYMANGFGSLLIISIASSGPFTYSPTSSKSKRANQSGETLECSFSARQIYKLMKTTNPPMTS
jgi:hypothetical protein